ncbi:hypothetical protein HYPBUDRAFT_154128 [Hyphopichia burtonii NRRL Y-1933]|uniref:Uncharacterized protein n=1 Tax=Hyphopichia burtonii NRRL Y-1933 TaxID=984485 RepID=A0A1E4RC10_9ASCO|nr:hypothetical protein HYPBUDRAFT_154128 [Hyphopichia burtonii NRRL Y-1933]ODV64781.1 hypothetical protein HYPBUDRAFT_154128 [Hyphopichia burtonii NRRL Y-1933]
MPPPTPPFWQRVVVGTLATIAGVYVMWDTGRDFEFVKFTPHLEEEIERRKRESIGMSMRHTDTRTLDYTPEAKERLKKLVEEKNAKEIAKEIAKENAKENAKD